MYYYQLESCVELIASKTKQLEGHVKADNEAKVSKQPTVQYKSFVSSQGVFSYVIIIVIHHY